MGSDREEQKAPRRHITTACDACRQSKIKCDGQKPCGNCTRKGKTAVCEYPTNEDKRRVQGTRYALELLSTRVEQLTTILTNSGLVVPPMKWEETKTIIDVCDGLKIPWPSNLVGDNSGPRAKSTTPSNTTPLGPSVPTPTGLQPQFSADTSSQNVALLNNTFASPTEGFPTDPGEWSWDLEADPWALWDPQAPVPFPPGMVPGNTLNNPSSIPYPNLPWPSFQPLQQQNAEAQPTLSSSKSSDEGQDDFDDKFINRFSARFGSLKIAPDGKIKYIGPASTANFLDDDDHYQQKEDIELRKLQKERETLLSHSLVGKPIDIALETHFIDLYFQHQEPVLPLVDQNIYNLARQRYRQGERDRGFYSDCLTNAMCALGAAHEPPFRASFNTYPRSLPVFFADRAKTLLQIDIQYPSVATVQALVLLSTHELASNKDAGGWSYTGMAMRLCLDLGLERDCTRFVEQSLIRPDEANARNITFWGCFVMNHFWSFHLGRPFHVEGEATAPKPMDPASPPWSQLQSISDLPQPEITLAPVSLEPFHHVIYLCEVAGPIMHDLFGTRSIEPKELQSRTEPVTTKLFTWKDSLPVKLQIDTSDMEAKCSRQLLMLHLLYHQIQILLHRPWTARHNQPVPLQGRGYRHAQGVCISSAKDIAKLLASYEARYPLKHMHVHSVEIISAAALIMIAVEHASHPSRRALVEQEVGASLGIYFRALDELSSTYDKAEAARDGLLAAQGSWMNRKKAGNGNQLKRGGISAQEVPTESKRLREFNAVEGSQTGASSLSVTQQETYANNWGPQWTQQPFDPDFES